MKFDDATKAMAMAAAVSLSFTIKLHARVKQQIAAAQGNIGTGVLMIGVPADIAELSTEGGDVALKVLHRLGLIDLEAVAEAHEARLAKLVAAQEAAMPGGVADAAAGIVEMMRRARQEAEVLAASVPDEEDEHNCIGCELARIVSCGDLDIDHLEIPDVAKKVLHMIAAGHSDDPAPSKPARRHLH